MSRILVTGADGFLGKEVIGILKKNNFEFVGVSKKNTRENYLFCDLSIPNDVLKLKNLGHQVRDLKEYQFFEVFLSIQIVHSFLLLGQ